MVTVRTIRGDLETRNSQSFGAIESPFGSWVFYPRKCTKVNTDPKTEREKKEGSATGGTKSPKGQSGGRCVLNSDERGSCSVTKDSDGWF